MCYPLLQFIQLENLLAEAAGADALRVHVEERVDISHSAALTRKKITIGLCVRAIAPANRLLSWYYQVDGLDFYTQGANGRLQNGRSAEQARYETAWQRAEEMKDELVSLLRRLEYTVHTDGILTLPVSPCTASETVPLLRGTTALVILPIADTEPARSL